MMRWMALCAWLVACAGGAQDIDTTGTTTLEAPDITGVYIADVVDQDGCEEAGEGLLDWMTGDLTVTGLPDELSFEFAGDVVVGGSVDTAFEVALADEVTVGDASFVLSGTGLAYIDAGLWILDVDLEVDASSASSEFPDCAAFARFEAGQVSE